MTEEPKWTEIEDRIDILLGKEINICRETAIDELEILEFSNKMTEKERIHRLLYLFHKDILSSKLGNKILEYKFIKDCYYQNKLNFPSYELKYTGKNCKQIILIIFTIYSILLILLMFGFLLYYSIISTKERQIGWVISFIIYLLLDFLFVCPCEVLISNIIIPNIILPDINIVRNLINNLKQQYNNNNNNLSEKTEINENSKESKYNDDPTTVHYNNINNNTTNHTNNHTNNNTTTTPLQLNKRRKNKKELHLLPIYHNNNTITTTNINNNNSNTTTTNTINSTKYFNVSNRISHYYTNLSEAQFILSYTTISPPGEEFPKSWFRPLNLFIQRIGIENQKLNRLLQRGGFRIQSNYPYFLDETMILLNFYNLFEYYIDWTYFSQDTFIHFIITCILFFLLLLHVELYNTIPYLVLLPLAVVIVLITIYYSLTSSHGLLRRLVDYIGSRNKIVPFDEVAI